MRSARGKRKILRCLHRFSRSAKPSEYHPDYPQKRAHHQKPYGYGACRKQRYGAFLGEAVYIVAQQRQHGSVHSRTGNKAYDAGYDEYGGRLLENLGGNIAEESHNAGSAEAGDDAGKAVVCCDDIVYQPAAGAYKTAHRDLGHGNSEYYGKPAGGEEGEEELYYQL